MRFTHTKDGKTSTVVSKYEHGKFRGCTPKNIKNGKKLPPVLNMQDVCFGCEPAPMLKKSFLFPLSTLQIQLAPWITVFRLWLFQGTKKKTPNLQFFQIRLQSIALKVVHCLHNLHGDE